MREGTTGKMAIGEMITDGTISNGAAAQDSGSLILITDFNDPRIDIFVRLPEVQLLRYREPAQGIFLAESPKVIERALDGGYEAVSILIEETALRETERALIARCPGVPVYVAPADVLCQMRGFQMTRGMLCAMNRRALPSVEAVCKGAGRVAVLEDVVNPTNVGAIIRSAAALGMDAVLCTSGCSDPLYRRAVRVSMGTVFQIPWTVMDADGMQTLKKLGFCTVAMALRDDSVSLDAPELATEERLAVVLGTEGDGLAPETIHACDVTVRIPMTHGVDSLNVAAASAVAFWQLGRH